MAELDIHFRITPRMARWSMAALCLALMALNVSPEDITLETYYPAPSGVYVNMVTTQQTILARDGGNVGIGTTGPGSKLQINGAGSGNVDLSVNGRIRTGDGGGNGGVWLSNAGNMFVGQNGANVGFWTAGAGWNAFQVTQGGYVGIGTTGPSQPLEVNGNIQADRNFITQNSGSCSVHQACPGPNGTPTGPNGGVSSQSCPGGDYATWTPGVEPKSQINAPPPNLMYFNGSNNVVQAYDGCVPAVFYCCPY